MALRWQLALEAVVFAVLTSTCTSLPAESYDMMAAALNNPALNKCHTFNMKGLENDNDFQLECKGKLTPDINQPDLGVGIYLKYTYTAAGAKSLYAPKVLTQSIEHTSSSDIS